jgi:hypothetical protein
MTNGPGPDGGQFPPHTPRPPADPYAPVDYPASPDLPPPAYPTGYPPPPGYPPPGYPPPPDYPQYAGGYQYGADSYDPYRPTKPMGTNGKAIAALATSLAGLLFCGFPSVVGLILGIIAMRETRRTGQDGYGLALAGVIVGGLVTALFAVYVLFFIGLAASGSLV